MSVNSTNPHAEQTGIDIEQLLTKFTDYLRVTPEQAGSVYSLSAQAYLMCLQSAAGLYSRAAMSWASYLGLLGGEFFSAMKSPEERARSSQMLIDETIAQLRELGEISVQEAQILQQNLTHLAERVRDLDQQQWETPKRHAQAKP